MEPVPTGGKLGFVEATSPGQCVGTLRWDESSRFPPLPAWPAPLVGDEMAMPEGWRDYLEMRLVPDAGVAAVPVSAFYLDPQSAPRNYIRFCFAKQDAVLDGAVERLDTYLKEVGLGI